MILVFDSVGFLICLICQGRLLFDLTCTSAKEIPSYLTLLVCRRDLFALLDVGLCNRFSFIGDALEALCAKYRNLTRTKSVKLQCRTLNFGAHYASDA